MLRVSNAGGLSRARVKRARRNPGVSDIPMIPGIPIAPSKTNRLVPNTRRKRNVKSAKEVRYDRFLERFAKKFPLPPLPPTDLFKRRVKHVVKSRKNGGPRNLSTYYFYLSLCNNVM